MATDRKVFALLIDGDNAQPALIPQILDKVKEYGDIAIKRVYGDWSQEQLKIWKEVVNRHAIETPHRFNGSKNKNATDIALVIDAMDILHEKRDKITAFCIISSDSDFAHLALRIRQGGLFVLGIGIEKTPFREVCDEFITTESFQNPISNNGVTVQSVSLPPVQVPFEILFINAYEICMDNNLQKEDGSFALQDIRDAMKDVSPESQYLTQKMPDFVVKTKTFADSYPIVMTLQELKDNKPVVHRVSLDAPMLKFWIAYQHALDVYKFTDTDDWVTLSAIEYAFNEMFSIEYSSIQKFLKALRKMKLKYPNMMELYEHADGEEITYYVRIGNSRTDELDKFQNAYTEAINADKTPNGEGWIKLSLLGTIIRNLYPSHDPLTYRGTRYSKLGKVVELLHEFHPDVIELRHENNTTFIRMKH